MSNWNNTEGWNSGFSGAVSGAQAGMSIGGPYGAVIGGLTGGAIGLFGHKKKTDWDKKSFNEQVRQFNVMDDFNKNQVQYRVKDALAAGINPLAALGVSSNYSPTISGGGFSSGEESGGFNNFLTSMSNIFNKQEKESRDLDLEAKRIRNRIAKEELNHLLQPGIVTNGSTDESLSKPKNPGWQIPMKMSLRDAEPLYLPWRTQDGRIVELLNPDAIADADITNMEAVRAYASEPNVPIKGTRDSLRYAVGARDSYFKRFKNKVRSYTDSRSWWR